MLQNFAFTRRYDRLARIEAILHLLLHSRSSSSPSPGTATLNSLTTECSRFFSWCTLTVTDSGRAAANPNWKVWPSRACGARNSLLTVVLLAIISSASSVV